MLSWRNFRIPLLAAAVVTAVLVSGAALTGCPTTGIRCSKNLTPCSNNGTCSDLQNDENNCGGCAVACPAAEVCTKGACVCSSGTVLCDGKCVNPNDPLYCGGCPATGTLKCTNTQVCEAGACKVNCEAVGVAQCGQSCVVLAEDAQNCGACGNVCGAKQTCHAGVCQYDVVVACLTAGQLVGVDDASLAQTAGVNVGTEPVSLGLLANTLLSLDGADQHLYEAHPTTFEQFTEAPAVEKFPNHLLVDGDYVYVANSGTSTLEILKRNGTAVLPTYFDGGTPVGGLLDGGLGLVPVSELAFGAFASPETVTKVGNFLYLPLNGLNTVAEVNITDPLHPTLGRSFDMSKVPLNPFPGVTPVAFPWMALARGGQLYVALNNLDPTTYKPGGNGTLGKVNLSTGAVSGVDLGKDLCLNAYWLSTSPDGGNLYVSCSGSTRDTGAPNYTNLGTTQQGVMVLDANDVRQGSWSPCVASSDADGGCHYFSPGRFGVKGNRLYVGDNSFGGLVVLDVDGGSLSERSGFHGGGVPLQACPLSVKTNNSNVGDVLVTP